MSLLHRDRKSTTTVDVPPPPPLSGGALRWRSAAAGGSAALMSMLTVAMPALLVWVASAQSTVEWTSALSVGVSAWLLAHGADLSSGPATISLMPWLLTAIPLAVATLAARRLLAQVDHGRARTPQGWLRIRRDVVGASLTFVLSYAAVGLVVALATSAQPLRASLSGSVLGTTAVGIVAVLIAISREFRGDIAELAPDLTAQMRARTPIYLQRAIRPGLWGAFAMFGAGLVLSLAMVVLHLGRIGELTDSLGADAVGIGALSLGQLLVLPNVALWAASWMSGPGFGFGQGTAITWSDSDPGLLPLIPGLGALPDPGHMPASLWLASIVPVVVGLLVGWRSVRSVARLSSSRLKASVAVSACVVAALVLTVGSALAGGSLGALRLSSVGAPSLMFGAAVLAELLLGAGVFVGLSRLRAGRR